MNKSREGGLQIEKERGGGEKDRERERCCLVQVVERCNHHYPIIIKVGKMAGRPMGARLERVGVNCRWGRRMEILGPPIQAVPTVNVVAHTYRGRSYAVCTYGALCRHYHGSSNCV